MHNLPKNLASQKTKLKGGAIPLGYEDPLNAFKFFLQNSTANFINANSLSGRIVILTLNPGIISPYTSYSAANLLDLKIGDVKVILLKFCLVGTTQIIDELHRLGNINTYLFHNIYSDSRKNIIKLEKDIDFYLEGVRQQEISVKTATKDPHGRYEMATPYIIYQSDLPGFSIDDNENEINKLLNNLFKDGSGNWPDFYDFAKKGINTTPIIKEFNEPPNLRH